MTIQKINGFQMHYELTGQGEPVLFIHGLGSSARDWENQIDYFSKEFQVLTIDVRGHGQSEKPRGPYTMPLFAQDVKALLKTLNFGPVHVVGISMGGMIGLQLAVDSPEMVKSLAVVNSSPEVLIKTFKEKVQVWLRFFVVRFVGMRKMGEIVAKNLFPKPEHAEIQKIFVERWAENDPRAYADSMRAIRGWSVSAHLEEIACPVLVLTADQDYTTVESKAAYAKRFKQSELVVIEDSHHGTPVDQPEEFNRVVMGFLKKHTGLETLTV